MRSTRAYADVLPLRDFSQSKRQVSPAGHLSIRIHGAHMLAEAAVGGCVGGGSGPVNGLCSGLCASMGVPCTHLDILAQRWSGQVVLVCSPAVQGVIVCYGAGVAWSSADALESGLDPGRALGEDGCLGRHRRCGCKTDGASPDDGAWRPYDSGAERYRCSLWCG